MCMLVPTIAESRRLAKTLRCAAASLCYMLMEIRAKKMTQQQTELDHSKQH